MIPSSRQALEALVTAQVRGRPLALLFDYDGTLTPLTSHPKLACLSPAMRQLLHDLAGLPRVAVGVISGRMLEDVRSKVHLPGLYYGGTSGLELDLRSVTIVHPEAGLGRALVREAAELLSPIVNRHPGAWLEMKSLGMTLHFRNVPGILHRRLCAQARGVFRPSSEAWRLVDGAYALEITPALGWTKASAVRAIHADLTGDPLLLYAGDDNNDADALEAVARSGGVALGIGPRAPADVACRLDTPRDLLTLLYKLRAALRPIRAQRRKGHFSRH